METIEPNISDILIQRLKAKGIESQILGRFIKDVMYAFNSDAELSPFELDCYLRVVKLPKP